MKLKALLILSLVSLSLSALAEKLELFAPIPGAILYEVTIVSEVGNVPQTFRLESPVLDTDKVASGNYVMTARFLNVREKWSPWTDKASLKIVKKIKSNTRDIFEDKFPFGGSIGFASFATKLSTGGYDFESNESVIRSKGFIQKHPFKITVAYDKSQHLTRFDSAILKQLNANASAGVNFWMVNFDGRNTTAESKGLINYTQVFAEFDYMYPFLDRWYVGSKFGLGAGLSYYARPELTYSVPFGDEFFLSASLNYEAAHVEQSEFQFDANGFGGFVNINYFLEI